MSAKHTAGSWTPEKSNGVIEEGYRTVIFDDRRRAICHLSARNNVANARLIAAAPELLASAEEFLPILERQLESINPNGAAEGSKAFQTAKERVARLKDAIDRAKGDLE